MEGSDKEIVFLAVSNGFVDYFKSSSTFSSKIKGLCYPLVVEVSGYVPRGYNSYERHYNKNDRATYESNDGLWLGVTAIVGGEEKDFAWKIKPVKGRFKETYKLSASDLVYGGSDATLIASLWESKVDKEWCGFSQGSSCKYCIKNGFHLEKRVIQKE